MQLTIVFSALASFVALAAALPTADYKRADKPNYLKREDNLYGYDGIDYIGEKRGDNLYGYDGIDYIGEKRAPEVPDPNLFVYAASSY